MNLNLKKFNMFVKPFIVLKKYFLNLSKLKKFLVFLLLFFFIPWTFSVILFYTRYALPTESYFSLEGHKIVYQKMGRYFEAVFDKDNKMVNERELVGYDVNKSQSGLTTKDNLNNLGDGIENTFKNTEYKETEIVFLEKVFFDSFLSCFGDSFLQPVCIGWKETIVKIKNLKSNRLISINGVLRWFNRREYMNIVYYEQTFISKDFLVFGFIKNSNYLYSNPNIYLYVYSIEQNKWLIIYEAEVDKKYSYDTFRVLNIE
jgi:hypothetical protein